VLLTLNDLEGQSPVASLFKCNPSNICAAFYQISTDSALSGPSATAGFLVIFGTLPYTELKCNITVIYLPNSPTYCCYTTLGNMDVARNV